MTCERHTGEDTRVIGLDDLLPTAEQLANLAYASLSGDPAARGVGGHGRRAISLEDSTGIAKEDTYDAALWIDDPFFAQMAADLREYARTGTWPRSRRTTIPKPCGATRPIDDPAEVKRLVGLYIDGVIGDRIDAALTPRQFGGRRRTSYVHHCRREHATVQDHMAAGLQTDIYSGHSRVLIVDLANAFGLAPRRAALLALREIGLDQEAAQFVWNIAKINAEHASGAEVQVDPRWGIEQGNVLSAALMNLVLAPILGQLEAEFDVHGWAFVDDLYVTMSPDEDGTDIFSFFRKVTRSAGFTNVRRLWTETDGPGSKNSRIVDTRRAPIRVLKTYDVDAFGVSLAPEKVDDLGDLGLRGRTSLNEIRHLSQCMALTGKAMRARTDLIGRSKLNPSNRTRTRARKERPNPLGPTQRPQEELQHSGNDRMQVGDKAGGRHRTHETPINTNKGSQVEPRRTRWTGGGTGRQGQGGDEGEEPKGEGGGPFGSSTPHPTGIELVRSQENQDLDPGAEDGSPFSRKSVDLPSPDGEGEPPGGGVPLPVDSPFFRPFDDPDIVKMLRSRGRLRLGEAVKGHRLVLAGLLGAIGPELDPRDVDRIVTTLVRAVRANRSATVLIDPREPWTGLRPALGRHGDRAYRCVHCAELDGLVELHLELRGIRGWEAGGRARLPDSMLQIHSAKMSSSARREVELQYTLAGRRLSQHKRVDSPVAAVAKIEALALLAQDHRCLEMAVPTKALVHALDPAGDRRPAHVGLARAIAELRSGRRWRRRGRWFIGEPTTILECVQVAMDPRRSPSLLLGPATETSLISGEARHE